MDKLSTATDVSPPSGVVLRKITTMLFIFMVALLGVMNQEVKAQKVGNYSSGPPPGFTYFEIHDDYDLMVLNNWVTGKTPPTPINCRGITFNVMRNIGSPAFPVTQMIGDDDNHFAGNLIGNCHIIYVRLLYFFNDNVGLFSVISAGSIEDLIIEGSINGNLNTGAFAGKVSGENDIDSFL